MSFRLAVGRDELQGGREGAGPMRVGGQKVGGGRCLLWHSGWRVGEAIQGLPSLVLGSLREAQSPTNVPLIFNSPVHCSQAANGVRAADCHAFAMLF